MGRLGGASEDVRDLFLAPADDMVRDRRLQSSSSRCFCSCDSRSNAEIGKYSRQQVGRSDEAWREHSFGVEEFEIGRGDFCNAHAPVGLSKPTWNEKSNDQKQSSPSDFAENRT
jgi:hypothetical protein